MTLNAVPWLTVERLRVLKQTAEPLWDIEQLTLFSGDRCWIRGGNGTGKTTLLKCLAGLTLADAGSIRQLVPHKAIYLHTVPYLFKGTVRDNLAYAVALGQARYPQEDLISASKLTGLLDKDVRVLSAGERQRVGLARALLASPDVLYLDEPCANLDDDSLLAVLELLTDFFPANGVIVLVSHQENALTASMRSVKRLTGGQLINEG